MKFSGIKAFVTDKAQQASQSVSAFVESDDTKAAVAWTKKTALTAAGEAKELGKRAAKSEMGKDAATGAAIGAAVAVPIPFVGPIIGGILGAGAGVALGLKHGTQKKYAEPDKKTASLHFDIDVHKKLIDLDDLRQKGILSQEEFNVEKKKILNN